MTISKYYQKNIEDIINEFETDIEKGLSIEEVKRRQEKYGRMSWKNRRRNLGMRFCLTI